MIYLIVIILLLLLSFRYDIVGRKKYRDQIYLFMLAVFILIAGLRWRIGLDTANYLYFFYHKYPDVSGFSFKDYPFGNDPLYVFLISLVKSLGGRFYVVQIIHATFVNGLIFNYIKKHSPYIFTTLFFYAIIIYLGYNTEIMRGSISIVICLYVNDFILEKKWFRGYSLLIIASMFHAQTILMFVMPLFLFLKFNYKGVIFLIGAFGVGQILEILVSDYFVGLLGNSYIDDKAVIYSASNQGYKMELKSMLYYIGVPIIYLFSSISYMKKHEPSNSLLQFEPFLMFHLLFLMMQSGFPLAHRYMEYYSIYAAIFYSYGFVQLVKNRKLKTGLSYVRAVVIFIPIIWMFSQILISKKIGAYSRYLPYSSIIEKSVDKERERVYQLNGINRANYLEY